MKRIPFVNDDKHQQDLLRGKYLNRSDEASLVLLDAGLVWTKLFNWAWGTMAIAVSSHHDHQWRVMPIVSIVWSEPGCQGEPSQYEITESADLPAMIGNLLKGGHL